MRPILLLFAATAALAQSPIEKAYTVLDTATKDANPAKRIAALQSMGVISPQARPVALVEGMLNDKDSGTRQSACTTLGEMKSRASIPKLQEALNDKAPEVVFAAARSLYAMGDPGGRAILISVLGGDQADSSGLIASSLRDAKLKLHDPKALLLIGVNESAGLLGPFGIGVPIAERLMKDKESSGKTAAALLLATDTSEDSKKAIRAALSDKNWTVRAAAARAVAIRGITAYYEDVAAMLDDKRDEVTYTAAAVVIRLKQPPAGRSGPPRRQQ
jgi:HEAT repeat protein